MSNQRTKVILAGMVFCAASMSGFSKRGFAQLEKAITTNEISDEIFKELSSSPRRLIVNFGDDGSTSTGWMSSFWLDQHLRYYNTESVWEELELVDAQLIDVMKVTKNWKSEIEKKEEEQKTLPRSNGAYKELFEDWKAINRRNERKFLDVLLPHQRVWFRQIHMRYLVRTNGGLVKFVSSKSFLKHSGLTKAQLQKLKNNLYSEKDAIRDSAMELKKEIVVKLLEKLTDPERVALIEKWPYLNDDKRPDLERIRIHLLIVREEADFGKSENPFEQRERVPYFEMDVSGALSATERMGVRKKKYSEDQLASVALGQFSRAFKSDGFADALQLTDDQSMQLDEVMKEYRRAMNELMQLNFQFKGNKEELVAMVKKSKEIRSEADSYGYRDVREVLSESQWEKFQQLTLDNVAKIRGPLFDLTQGELARRLEITADRGKEMAKQWFEVLEVLEERVNPIENVVIDRFQSELPEPAKKLFKSLIGRPLTKSPANIGALLSEF